MKILTEEQILKIRSNPNNYNWIYLSYNYLLSEDFIREFKDKVWWDFISKFQTLSETFIREFYNKLNPEYLIQNKNIPKPLKDTIKLLS